MAHDLEELRSVLWRRENRRDAQRIFLAPLTSCTRLVVVEQILVYIGPIGGYIAV